MENIAIFYKNTMFQHCEMTHQKEMPIQIEIFQHNEHACDVSSQTATSKCNILFRSEFHFVSFQRVVSDNWEMFFFPTENFYLGKTIVSDELASHLKISITSVGIGHIV